MKLIDTSCWIHALRRRGDAGVRQRVTQLLEQGEAAWCQIIRLELWRGAENEWDKQLMQYFSEQVMMLAINSDTWERAIHFSQESRAVGLSIPLPDLIIFSCAAVHNVEVEHSDRHFDLLKQTFPKGI